MNETPKRSVGVTLSAVVSILGSALVILFALLMLLAMLLQKAQPAAPAYLKAVMLSETLLFASLAAWGITTAVGLFRLRGWARSSIIVFSALLAVICGSGGLVMAVVRLPETPGAPPGLMTVVKVEMISFYALLALIGGFWLYYFHTAGVRAQFGAGTEGPGGRPLSVSIIAWFLIVGGIICLTGVFLPFPAMVFGLMFHGWTARIFYLAFAGFECWLGAGLLRLRPLSRVLAIALFAFAVVNSVLLVVLPGFPERFRDMMSSLPAGWPGADQAASLPSPQPAMVVGALVSLIPIWFLVARRAAFARSPGSEQIAGQQPL